MKEWTRLYKDSNRKCFELRSRDLCGIACVCHKHTHTFPWQLKLYSVNINQRVKVILPICFLDGPIEAEEVYRKIRCLR